LRRRDHLSDGGREIKRRGSDYKQKGGRVEKKMRRPWSWQWVVGFRDRQPSHVRSPWISKEGLFVGTNNRPRQDDKELQRAKIRVEKGACLESEGSGRGSKKKRGRLKPKLRLLGEIRGEKKRAGKFF